MSRQLERFSKLRFLSGWGAAGFCEIPVLALLLGWPLPISLTLTLLLHVAAALLTFAAPPKAKGLMERSRHWGEPAGLIVFLLPGVGWAIAGWMVLTQSQAPLAKDAYIFDEEQEDDVNPLAGLAAFSELPGGSDEPVMPAVDALLSPNPGLRRGAIEALSKIRTPEAIAWLLKVRTWDDPETRFYATTALTRLKHDFDTALRASEREIYRNPDSIDHRIALERVRLEYACSGMLDGDSRRAMLEDGKRRLLEIRETSEQAARLLYMVERHLDPKAALLMLDSLEEAYPERIAYWRRERANLLFSQSRWWEVRQLFQAGESEFLEEGDVSVVDREWRSLTLWWAHD